MLSIEQLEALKTKPRRLWQADEVVGVIAMAKNWYSHENTMTHAIQYWKERALSAEHERDAVMKNLQAVAF